MSQPDTFSAWRVCVQYEELTEEANEDQVLQGILRHVNLPTKGRKSELTRVNTRRFGIGRKGWDMKRRKYKQLIDLVEPDVHKLLKLLETHGKLNAKGRREWLKRWEAVWKDNLNSCDRKGDCKIVLS